MTIDWEGLRARAEEAAVYAHAPYSGYRVGAAAIVDDGRIVTGCNVESASYGLTLCAECGLVSELHRSGGGRLVAFTCVGGPPSGPLVLVSPCGRCRQLLFEAGGPDLLVETDAGVLRMDVLLPDAFGPDRLP